MAWPVIAWAISIASLFFTAAVAQCSATTTIQSQGDAGALASCTTFTGDIVIATGAVDDIVLDGIYAIERNLTAVNVSGLTGLTLNGLATISGTFTLYELTILSVLSIVNLTSVGNIDWFAIPSLPAIGTTGSGNGIQYVDGISVQYTQFTSLAGIDPLSVMTLDIAQNPYLEIIEMSTLSSVSTYMNIQANGRNLTATFDKLENAYSITLSNLSSVSFPTLQSVNDSLSVSNNYFPTFPADTLTTVGGLVNTSENANLNNISMPLLSTVVGGLLINNNTGLVNIGFSALKVVGGTLDYNGDFTTVYLPALSDVRGDLTLQSAEDIKSTCNTFQALAGANSVIKGTFTCDSGSGVIQPNSSSNGTSTSVSSASSTTSRTLASSSTATGSVGMIPMIERTSSLSTGAKAGIGVGVGCALVLGMALIGVILYYKRKERRKVEVEEVPAAKEESQENNNSDGPIHEMTDDTQRHELAQQHGASELGRSTSGRLLSKEERHGLAGKHGISELLVEQRHELEGRSMDMPRNDVDK